MLFRSEVILESWDRVASLYGSFAETWLLAGGTLAGTTEDAVSERGLELGEDVAVVGTVKEPSLEEVLAGLRQMKEEWDTLQA